MSDNICNKIEISDNISSLIDVPHGRFSHEDDGYGRLSSLGGALVLGAACSLPHLAEPKGGVKRPLPCQQIQYLDISYQKVSFRKCGAG